MAFNIYKRKEEIDMKKRVFLAPLLSLAILTACSTGSQQSQKSVESSENHQEESTAETKKANLADSMEITEYSLENSLGNTNHYYIVKNNSDKTVKVDFNTTALNSSGEIIGAQSSDVYALGSGCTSCALEIFDDVTGVDQFKHTLSVKEDEDYKSVIQDIAVDISQQPEKVIVTCTNNGDSAAEYLNVSVLFFKDGKYIGSAGDLVSDDDYELKPNATLSTQFDSYQDYDDIKVYLSGGSRK
jgi:hypothetical protein